MNSQLSHTGGTNADTYTDRPASYPSAPGTQHTAAWKPGTSPHCGGMLPPQLVLLVGVETSLHPINFSGLIGVCGRGGRESLWPPGFWENRYRNLALWSANCCHPHQSQRPHPEGPSPEAALWTACVVIAALKTRQPAKPQETWSLGQLNAFPLGTGKKEGVE